MTYWPALFYLYLSCQLFVILQWVLLYHSSWNCGLQHLGQGAVVQVELQTHKHHYQTSAELLHHHCHCWVYVYHGGDSLLALFILLQWFQEVLQDFVVSGQLTTNTQGHKELKSFFSIWF